jgi:hypothetical protein
MKKPATVICLVLGLIAAALPASAADESQYRAAMTQLFLGRYQAMPLFRLNPVWLGDVLTLKNETKYVSADKCYPALKQGGYKEIQGVAIGNRLALTGDLKVGGDLIVKEIASVEAKLKVKFASAAYVQVKPLAADQTDAATLKAPKGSDPNCKIIFDVIAGKPTGQALVQQVLHGRIELVLASSLEGSVDAQAQAELLKAIAGAFKIKEAEIQISGRMASFAVSESTAPMSLAFVPYGYSSEEVARIAKFMEGKRGAALEIAVRTAIGSPPGILSEAKLWIQDILGSGQLELKERWAERMIGVTPVEEIRQVANFEQVAAYAAAMELVRSEAPQRIHGADR